jgi:hypothetical protein
MNFKKFGALFASLALILLVGVVPAYAGNRHSNSEEEDVNSWLDFDDENNGETFTWEGKPMSIKLHENWSNEDWPVVWGNSDESHEDEDNRGGNDWEDSNEEEESDYEDEDEDSDDSEDGDEESNEDSDSETEFDLDLSGEEEVPGPGDDEGEGWANLRLHEEHGLVCVDMEVSGINLPATDAHIHKAAKGQSGPVVLALPIPNEEGDAYGCVKATSTQLTEMMNDPELFYVNVHSEDYPDGAVRGQLSDSEEEED